MRTCFRLLRIVFVLLVGGMLELGCVANGCQSICFPVDRSSRHVGAADLVSFRLFLILEGRFSVCCVLFVADGRIAHLFVGRFLYMTHASKCHRLLDILVHRMG